MAAKKGKKVISVNFAGVSVTGGTRVIPEGPIQLEIIEVTEEESEAGKPYLKMTLQVSEDGDYKGAKVYDNLSLQPQALWKLRGVLEAAGIPTTDSQMDIDPDDMVGCVVQGDIVHEEYKGKTQNRVNGYSSVEDTTTEEEEGPEEGASSSVRKKKAAPAEEAAEWKVKQSVSFKDGKKVIEGIISEIDGNDITVKVGKEEYVCAPEDLTTA